MFQHPSGGNQQQNAHNAAGEMHGHSPVCPSDWGSGSRTVLTNSRTVNACADTTTDTTRNRSRNNQIQYYPEHPPLASGSNRVFSSGQGRQRYNGRGPQSCAGLRHGTWAGPRQSSYRRDGALPPLLHPARLHPGVRPASKQTPAVGPYRVGASVGASLLLQPRVPMPLQNDCGRVVSMPAQVVVPGDRPFEPDAAPDSQSQRLSPH